MRAFFVRVFSALPRRALPRSQTLTLFGNALPETLFLLAKREFSSRRSQTGVWERGWKCFSQHPEEFGCFGLLSGYNAQLDSWMEIQRLRLA